MPLAAAKPHLISAEEYLALEEKSPEKNELVAGEVYAMAGATVRHNQVAGNLYLALRMGLAGRPCAVFMSDVKVHAARADAYYYPDIVVRCAAAALPGDTRVVADPTLVVEVLSPSTEAIDRREKLAAYRQIPSLQEYVLVAQDEASVEIYRRQGDIGWLYLAFTGEETARLESVGLDLPLAEIYAAGA